MTNSNAVIITGATSGIGFATAAALAKDNFFVIGIGKDPDKCSDAENKLRELCNSDSIHFLHADLLHLSEVSCIADNLLNLCRPLRLHALINNAASVRSRYMTTFDGFEHQFALNYLSHFLLTHLLLPIIIRDSSSLIFTSSESHKRSRINWNDIMFQKRYNPLLAYKQSKLCIMLFVLFLRHYGYNACAVDPGLVNTNIGNKNTGSLVNLIWNLRKRHGISPDIPARTFLSLCLNPFDGLYFDSNLTYPKAVSSQVNLPNASRLYSLSLKLAAPPYSIINREVPLL